ncbi:Type 1 glutamine amidotransferase-like domain-containing protein [Actinoalloteichus hymeniacidonis]|uniref:Peptidase E n=1 Tax=Actinoalloteichus hymeniacidonis TaxID=340345 RepID=A0AAC9MZZ6_9PSEU|nr:peptidase E [Actinoalloteichus hymeniacidonis]AOS65039.1 peptidase E [Actinoalloteichus hymeniacidonis]MBB5906882.1 peptidase E [Actinoalloteichus hymeniacidonis]
MPADAPTILATSGGMRPGASTDIEFAPLLHFAIEQAGVTGRRPRLAVVGTAGGDQRWRSAMISDAGQRAGIDLTQLDLFPMPATTDLDDLVLGQDVVWVDGGSVANLLAVWRVHGLPEVFRRAWAAGVVLAGISAGSLCWFVGGPTDSFGPALRVVTNGLALLPYGNGVHYDSEPARRPAVQAAVAAGELPLSYCTDDGAGLLFRGRELVEAVTERPNAGAYRVERAAGTPNGVVEHRIPVRRLH